MVKPPEPINVVRWLKDDAFIIEHYGIPNNMNLENLAMHCREGAALIERLLHDA